FSQHPLTYQNYTLSLHDALPICLYRRKEHFGAAHRVFNVSRCAGRRQNPEGAYSGSRIATERAPLSFCGGRGTEQRGKRRRDRRSEEHTSELQSLAYLVCRLLLE